MSMHRLELEIRRDDTPAATGMWATGGQASIAPTHRGSVATLLTANALRDGELVLLVLRPSRWFIVLSSLPFVVGATLVMAAVWYTPGISPPMLRLVIDLGLLAGIARLMWAVLVWMSRLYVLTDQRVMRISGIFSTDVFECPLRKIAKTWVLQPVRERLLNLGTVLIVPADANRPAATWQTLSHPHEVERTIREAIAAAGQRGAC